MYALESLELWTWLNIRSTIANHTYRQLLRRNEAQKEHTYPDKTIKLNLSFFWTVYVTRMLWLLQTKITEYTTYKLNVRNASIQHHVRLFLFFCGNFSWHIYNFYLFSIPFLNVFSPSFNIRLDIFSTLQIKIIAKTFDDFVFFFFHFATKSFRNRLHKIGLENEKVASLNYCIDSIHFIIFLYMPLNYFFIRCKLRKAEIKALNF